MTKAIFLPICACVLGLTPVGLVSAAQDGNNSNTLQAVQEAISSRDATALEKLIRDGAPVNDFISDELAPLHIAASAGETTIIRILAEAGAYVDLRAGTSGMTPLMFAACNGHPGAVKTLLELGASAGIRDAKGRSASYYAAEGGDQEVADILSAHIAASGVLSDRRRRAQFSERYLLLKQRRDRELAARRNEAADSLKNTPSLLQDSEAETE